MDLMRTMGSAMRGLRPGPDALASTRLARRLGYGVRVSSPAFAEGGAIPRRFTADGEKLFPGIAWEGLPPHTESVVLLVEDADIPWFRPVAHVIVHAIPPGLGGLGEGAVPARQRQRSPQGWRCGRNFLGALGWTPPAPPPGHGAHRYAFQVFALSGWPQFEVPPGRTRLVRTMLPYVIGQGCLIGTYERT